MFMTEVEEVLHEDTKEKKQIAVSSKFMNRRLNQDSKFYSKRELKKLNGETKVYNLKEPMSWKKFQSLSDDMQDLYLSGLYETYHVSVAKLATMFQISGSHLIKYLHKKHFQKFQIPERGHKMSKSQVEEFESFLNMFKPVTPDDKPTATSEPVSVNKVSHNVNQIPAQVNRLSLGYDGEINLDEIVTYLQLVLGEKFTGHLDIQFTR